MRTWLLVMMAMLSKQHVIWFFKAESTSGYTEPILHAQRLVKSALSKHEQSFSQDWLAQVRSNNRSEQRIIDHHHLWPGTSVGSKKSSNQYLLEELWADTGSGHNITNTVFIDCGQCYWDL